MGAQRLDEVTYMDPGRASCWRNTRALKVALKVVEPCLNDDQGRVLFKEQWVSYKFSQREGSLGVRPRPGRGADVAVVGSVSTLWDFNISLMSLYDRRTPRGSADVAVVGSVSILLVR